MRPFIRRLGIIILSGGAIFGAYYRVAVSSHALSTPNPGVLRAQKQPMSQQAITQAAQHTNRGQDIGGVPPVPVPAYPDPSPMNPADMQPPGGQPYQAVSEWQDGYVDNGLGFVAIFGGVSTTVPNHGVISIYVFNGGPHNLVPGEGIWIAPWSTGAITITNVVGNIISWKGSNGMTGTFVMDAHQWQLNP